MTILSAYNVNGEIEYDSPKNHRYDRSDPPRKIEPIVTRHFLDDEIKFGKINDAGNDIEVDIVKKNNHESLIKDERIIEIKKMIEKELSDLDHKVLPDYPYQGDQQAWIDHRILLRNNISLLGNMTLTELSDYVLPTRPF